MPEVTCENKTCGKTFYARAADRKRGWGRFCSKSCKAQRQTALTGVSGPDYSITDVTVTAYRDGKRAKSKFDGVHKGGRNHLDGHVCDCCGEPATAKYRRTFVDIETINEEGLDPNFEYQCDLHYDDTHPFDMDHDSGF